jgi:3-oxoacyl-[acyl-carrier protein] reductase
MINLKDHKTLITGGSRGIGRAAALLFAEAGADVAITYQCRDEAALAVQAEVAKKGRSCLI